MKTICVSIGHLPKLPSLRKASILRFWILFSVLNGPFIEAEHCIFRHEFGEVSLVPLEGALCSINNDRIHNEVTKLNQGAMIRLGKRHLFRFNHPGEAAMLREQLKGVSEKRETVK